jgi:uncharacterized protein (DUF2336 family)
VVDCEYEAVIATDVRKLVDLARDKSSLGRSSLVTAIGDLMDDSGRILTLQEKALMNDILKKLIQDVARPIRKALAEKLSRSHNAPHEVVSLLANDEFDIASPVLLKSDLLSDEDLIEIVRHRTLSHRLAIAMRRSVSTLVSDALVGTNSVDVIKTLLENHGAQITDATMAYLVQQSESVDEFQEPLLRRKDLPLDLSQKMYVWVSAALRQYIVENYAVDKADLDLTVANVTEDVSSNDDYKRGDDAAMALAEQLARRNELTADMLVKTLRRGEIALFEAMLAQMLSLRPQVARKLIYEDGGEGLVIGCRACSINRTDFTALFLMLQRARPNELANNPYQLSRSMEMFDRLKPDTARKVVERWKINPHFLKSIRRLEQRPRG